MQKDATQHIRNCERCLKFKAKPARTELQSIKATYPLELVHMDYFTIESEKGNKDVNIMVITDHFIRYAQAFITPNQSVKVLGKTLWDKFIVHYGLLEKILLDQGRHFESDLIQKLCKLIQVRKLRTKDYHPRTNGQCEGFNRTLINMVGTLPDKPKSQWPGHLSILFMLIIAPRITY